MCAGAHYMKLGAKHLTESHHVKAREQLTTWHEKHEPKPGGMGKHVKKDSDGDYDGD